MRKILGDDFAERCRKLLAVEGANMYSVARKLKCSPSTVYRATGGKRRTLETSQHSQRKWAETTRRGRTQSGKSRNVGRPKAEIVKERRRGKPDGRTQRHTRKRALSGTI